MERKEFAVKLLGSTFDHSWREGAVDAVLQTGKALHEPAKRSPGYRPLEQRQLRPGEKCWPTTCFSCHSTCEALVYTDEKTGRVLRCEGDPESPQTHGRLCAKGLASPDLCYNPNRVNYPLKRVGERGEGRFERISWEEALDTVARKLTEYKEKLGPEGVAILEGTRRGWSRVYSRFANVFGTPNNGAAGWAQCLWPRLIDCSLTFGPGSQYAESFDLPNADVILCWGINPPMTWGVRAGDIMDARQRGAVLICVDPFLSETAAKADLWLQVRPDTDTALALGLIHIIIEEGLYDREFVKEWTYGFEELRESVKDYTAEWTARKTGVTPELIRKAARLYAGARASSLIRCLAVDQQHDSMECTRAISILISITGNIGKPGSNIVGSSRGEISQNTLDFVRASAIPPETQKKRCGYEQFPLLTQELSPVPTAHMPTLWQQVISSDPYPIRCALIFGSNALVSYTNSDLVEQAIRSLDFLAVCDIFMTPTAKMADIVLPASSWLERNNVISSFQTDNCHTLIQQKITEIAEARNDVDIICDLARRLGLEKEFWKDHLELYDQMLAPAGETFESARRKRRLYAPLRYELYKKKGFKTPSGKIELYSRLAEQKGCMPLPVYTPSFEGVDITPELARQYPLLMTTGRHESAYRISENRTNPYLRELAPRAFLDINPKTAEKLGIRDGQRVRIETEAGCAYAYARFTMGLREDVVQGISGWWGEYNINKTVGWGQYAAGVGTVCDRGYLCRVLPAEEEEA